MLLLSCLSVMAQHTLRLQLKDAETKEALVGAAVRVESTGQGAASDAEGIVTLTDVPAGDQILIFSYVGYETERATFHFPHEGEQPVEFLLEPDEEMLDEVVVVSVRGTRTIQNVPTRVEFISGEELDEKGSMKPGDIRMLLNESTGIITQQTSAISGNASIRIQGLDGRYTQILKDGFPVFAGAASGLGLLQTPPLDLKQVEIIKGASSTLYGGGAIAGLVNLISKEPEEERDWGIHLNGTTGKGLDVSTFFGQRFDRVGTTVFAAYNRNWAYDPSDTGFTAIPKFDRFTLNPRLFLYFNDRTEMSLGLNSMLENRLGGDIRYVQGHGDSEHCYFERNKTQRHSAQLVVKHRPTDDRAWNLKSSLTYFTREISIPDYTFDGTQVSSFTELNHVRTLDSSEWVGGLNLWTEHFEEQPQADFPLRDYNQLTLGAFVQNDWTVCPWLNLETGLRADYVHHYGWAILPRVSALFRLTDNLTSRVGGGMGYKAPTIFTEDSERIQFQGVMPISDSANKLERSYGANADFNYTTTFANDRLRFSLNQLFFYTYLSHPLLLEAVDEGRYAFFNTGKTTSKGCETNVKLGYADFNLYLGYTYTDMRTDAFGTLRKNLLTPKHRLNSVLMYEVEDKWKVGLEAYYFSRQRLNDGLMGQSYVVCGCMIEKIWERFSIYANFENFTDRRQTRFDTIYTGSVSNPVFRDIYAPLDGFVMNAGIKIRL